ncbi:hypothetical protein C0993_012413 [Termitomyces sp. T159_Od127]|nr:hypothetical protein C0993_012413 [Termitomyces sp. T159_Od127]
MTTESLTAHAESTSSPLLYLLLSLLSVPSSALSHAASHLGTAQTFTTLLRALPYHAKQGHVIIPAEITAKHGAKQEDVLRYGSGAEGISDAVFEFATLANDHLITARDMMKEEGMGGKVPARAVPVFLAGLATPRFPSSLFPSRFSSKSLNYLLGSRKVLGVMERLCNEVIQVIFYELPDPGPLTHVNKRFYCFSREPYVRAHYFLTHYGPAEAMFHALGRGKILDERVLDVSMHHYFHTASHFIKSPWVRTVPLGVYLHFLKLAEAIYGNIPRAKSEDDGYIFNTFLKQSRWPTSLKTVKWDTIREILEKYNDPLMAQFPLALAIEPRLLPFAVRNGFFMDRKYRDFVFRKMFERTASTSDAVSEDIVHNVRELCRLDPTMFVSRTVAAEVCMEAKVNLAGYHALKVLDKSGDLRFELGNIHAKLEAKNLTPITRKDVFNVLLNPFISDPQPLIDYAAVEMKHPEEERKGMSTQEGNLLSHLEFRYEFVKDIVKEVVLKYRLDLEDLPPSDDRVACRKFEAKLAQDHTIFDILSSSHTLSGLNRVVSDAEQRVPLVESLHKGNSQDMEADNSEDNPNLVCLGRRPFPMGLDKDAAADTIPIGRWIKETFGPRSRLTAIFMTHAVVNNSDDVGVSITEFYMPNRSQILDNFLPSPGGIIRLYDPSERVPITLKHFKILARVRKTPNHRLYTEIFKGCEFYLDEEDYIQDKDTSTTPIKIETSSGFLPSSATRARLETFSLSSADIGGRKRPRRTATTIKSYATPDSSDEFILDDDVTDTKPRYQESNLQKWISHLGELLKEEKRKHKEQKRKPSVLPEPGAKSRVYKSDFYKSLLSNLRELRLKEEAKRMELYGRSIPQNDGTDEDDDEYPQTTRTKRRKITRTS